MSGKAKYQRLVAKARKHILRRIKQEWTGTPVSLADVQAQAAEAGTGIDHRFLEVAANGLVSGGFMKPTSDPDVFVPLMPGCPLNR